MEIGMCIFSGVSPEKMVECFHKFGVTRTFIGSENPDIEKIMSLFRENHIICETLHAPFNGINDMWSRDEEKGAAMLARLIDGVDKCEAYGVPVLITHVSSGRPMPEITPEGEKRYQYLVDYAKKKGVTIAFENLRYMENLRHILEICPDGRCCWDSGHENCYTPGEEYLPLFGEKLVALHIHDNRGVSDADDHVLPFDGAIDMEELARKLAANGYCGTLMLEITKNAHFDGQPLYAHLSDEEYIQKAVTVARKLADSVEAARKER